MRDIFRRSPSLQKLPGAGNLAFRHASFPTADPPQLLRGCQPGTGPLRNEPASIKAGTVTASLILRKLGAYPRQNGLARAPREIGRLERMLFTLQWLQDPALRRRTNAGLNKGEARNALARAVFFHRLGEIRDRSYENQRYCASGLNLVVAAITLWNTVYLERAVSALREQGASRRQPPAAPDAPGLGSHQSDRGLHLAFEQTGGQRPGPALAGLEIDNLRGLAYKKIRFLRATHYRRTQASSFRTN